MMYLMLKVLIFLLLCAPPSSVNGNARFHFLCPYKAHSYSNTSGCVKQFTRRKIWIASAGIFCYVCAYNPSHPKACKDYYVPLKAHIHECFQTENACLKEKSQLDELGERVERKCGVSYSNESTCVSTQRSRDGKGITLCTCSDKDACNAGLGLYFCSTLLILLFSLVISSRCSHNV